MTVACKIDKKSWILAVVLVIMNATLLRGFGLKSSALLSIANQYGINVGKRAMSVSMTSTYTESEKLQLRLNAANEVSFTGDLLIVPFYKPQLPKDEEKLDAGDTASDIANALKNTINEDLSSSVREIIMDILDEHSFKADISSKQVVRLGRDGVKYVALVGLGPKPSTETCDLEVMSANRLGKLVSNIAKDVKAKSVGVTMMEGVNNAGLSQFILGIHDAAYKDNRYRKVPEGGFPVNEFKELTLLGCSDAVVRDIELTYKLTEMIASGVKFAKDLVGAPSNSKTPLVIADLARQMAEEHNLEVNILGAEECEALNMGGYLGVQQGSKFPPQFVHLTYKPDVVGEDVQKVALIGKGLTFDSGGYNLKAGAGSMIELMKFDMGGCASVLGCAKAIAQLRPRNVEVHFISAVCENMISAEAMRPGDILVASNGKTIEVLNTDAEGRLTLADALVYAEKLGADYIIDLATLTGASIVGLGDKLAALYSDDSELKSALESAAKRTDEGIWALPLHSQYKEMIKGTLGDIKNIGGKGGGSITAALFLQEFVTTKKWAHIDMAGPVWDNGPTGYGVKMLVDYLLNLKAK